MKKILNNDFYNKPALWPFIPADIFSAMSKSEFAGTWSDQAGGVVTLVSDDDFAFLMSIKEKCAGHE